MEIAAQKKRRKSGSRRTDSRSQREKTEQMFFVTFWTLQAKAEVSGLHDDSQPPRIDLRIQNVSTVNILGQCPYKCCQTIQTYTILSLTLYHISHLS